MDSLLHVPPGFRFHPTDEELVDYYLRRKVASKRIDFDVIKDVDLYKIEPWDLQEKCRISADEQNEWYFFSHKDKKYPTGTRTNRATAAGFWKATGRDKTIYCKHSLVGMRKTLVFYKGRAPNGQKSDWIMHEYRLETNELGPPQEDGWVVCRVFKKRIATTRTPNGFEQPCWYEDPISFIQDVDSSPGRILQHEMLLPHPFSCKREVNHNHFCTAHIVGPDPSFKLPQLESRKHVMLSSGECQYINTSGIDQFGHGALHDSITQSTVSPFHQDDPHQQSQMSLLFANHENQAPFANHQKQADFDPASTTTTDWRCLDKFVASQLSQEEGSKAENFFDSAGFHVPDMNHLDHNAVTSDIQKNAALECSLAPAGTSKCSAELWK